MLGRFQDPLVVVLSVICDKFWVVWIDFYGFLVSVLYQTLCMLCKLMILVGSIWCRIFGFSFCFYWGDLLFRTRDWGECGRPMVGAPAFGRARIYVRWRYVVIRFGSCYRRFWGIFQIFLTRKVLMFGSLRSMVEALLLLRMTGIGAI